MFDNILVVCHGNICRSPLGEAFLKNLLSDKNIQSAGLGALVGNNADTMAIEIAKEEGLDISQHKSRQITNEMIQWADVILVMSEDQRGAIGEKMPTAVGKTMLFGQWLMNQNSKETGRAIPDPYRKSREAFIHVTQLLGQAAKQWQQKLN